MREEMNQSMKWSHLKMNILLAGMMAALLLVQCKPRNTAGEGFEITGDPAIDALTEAIHATPNDPELYLQRSQIYADREAYDQAVRDLVQVMKLDSTHLRAHHLLADVYMDSYRSALALQTLQRAVVLYPDSIRTQLKLSEFELILKQYDAALKTLAGIMNIRPGDPEALFMLGMVYRDQGKTNLAIGAFQSAVERNPDMSEAWVILGDLMDRTNNPLASQYFDNAVRVAPDNVAAWHAKAYYLQNKDQISEALEIYKLIHTIDARYPEAYLNAAILYLYQDSLSAAMKELEILRQIDPTNPAAWFYKGKAHHLMGEPAEAKAAYEQALRLNPGYDQAKDGLQELRVN